MRRSSWLLLGGALWCLCPAPAFASNFGDFPAVAPFLLLTPFVCVLVGWLSSIKRDEAGHPAGVNRGRFVVVSLLMIPTWLGFCFVAFLSTL